MAEGLGAGRTAQSAGVSSFPSGRQNALRTLFHLVRFGGGQFGNFLCRPPRQRGDDGGEHAAVFQSFSELKQRNIEPRFAPLLSDGRVDTEALLSLVDDKTTLVSVVHVNNETGAVNDIISLAKAVKSKNPRCLFLSDGVQAFGKLPFRLTPDIDFYAISAHKIGGAKGTGALIRRKGVPLSPYIFGGGQEGGLRSGTENVFGILCFEAAAKRSFLPSKVTFPALKFTASSFIPRLTRRSSFAYRPRTARLTSSPSRRRTCAAKFCSAFWRSAASSWVRAAPVPRSIL